MEFARLTLDDEPEILALLQDVWPRLYGATGCPAFSSQYLRWLYGGPDAGRHLLVGCRIDGRLVGFKAYLSRDLRVAGVARSASMSTHLTILPELPPAARLAVATELSRLHPLAPDAGSERRDLLLAFFESNKTLLRNITRMAGQQGLSLALRPFRQAILNARRAKAAADGMEGLTVRAFDPATDLPAIRDLVSHQRGGELAWRPAEDVLVHHLTKASDAVALIAEDAEGRAIGLLGGYRMDWLKNGAVTRMFIVESLIAERQDAAASLLAAAADHGAEQRYRGVVIENPTMFPDAEAEAIGIAETAREMVLAVRSHNPIPDQIDRFVLDVK